VVKRVAFAIPGDLNTPTGGYAYDRRMIAELQKLGWQVDIIGLGDGFPRPDTATKAAARDKLAGVPKDCPVVVDGLALGVLPEAAKELREQRLLLALVHHPLALETGLTPADAQALKTSEYDALAAARGVVVNSPSTAQLLIDDYDVPPDLITIACPGTDRGATAQGSSDGVVRLVSVGAVVPRKGFDILIAALAMLPDRLWRLTIAGDRSRDPRTAAQLDADIARLNLGNRVTVLGAVSPERLEELYVAADLFALASRFEGYGMAYAEAIAHGLPVIGTTAGAIPDTVPAGTAVLVAPDDAGALALVLRRLIENPDERRRLAVSARVAARQLPTWRDSAKIFSRTLEDLA
jgi:glycosyltransferase involved in cell wall biosynthesis